MENLYLYAVQVNIALVVFYLLYRILFIHDTFLEVRRLFLMTVFFISFAYPGISLDSWIESQQPLQLAMVNYSELLTVAVSVVAPVETEIWTWQELLVWGWGIGGVILLIRMLMQLFQLCRMVYRGKKVWCKGEKVIALTQDTVPFSFFGWIFVNPARYEEKELAEIIAHEKTHVLQWHSLDMLCGECLCIVFWFNPFVWLFRREIRQNLEFLADKKVVSSGYNRKNYQYHLLRLSHQSTAVHIVNNFNVSPLKKRIIMMNKKRTSKIGLLKYALLVPVTGLLILSANADTVLEMADHTLQDWKTNPREDAKKTDKMLTGKVVDENGKPLSGASVIIKGKSVGTETDAHGNFTLMVSEPGAVCFSYVGKKTETIPFGMETGKMQVKLKNGNCQLEKVVVTGYSPEKGETEKQVVFTAVEEMPVFSQGSLPKYIATTIKYPVSALEKRIEGTVWVSFVINRQGKVTDTKVMKSVDPTLDKEALRVINTLPDWKPGRQRGKAVDVQFSVPIEFVLWKAIPAHSEAVQPKKNAWQEHLNG